MTVFYSIFDLINNTYISIIPDFRTVIKIIKFTNTEGVWKIIIKL